jgi:hypothetical protein
MAKSGHVRLDRGDAGSLSLFRMRSVVASWQRSRRYVGWPGPRRRSRKILRQISVRFSPAAPRVLSGVDGSPVSRVDVGLDKLAAQISQAVQWASCLEGCIEAGATDFLELGPGRALSKMVAGSYPDVPTRCLEDFRTLEGARSWLARHAGRWFCGSEDERRSARWRRPDD